MTEPLRTLSGFVALAACVAIGCAIGASTGVNEYAQIGLLVGAAVGAGAAGIIWGRT